MRKFFPLQLITKFLGSTPLSQARRQSNTTIFNVQQCFQYSSTPDQVKKEPDAIDEEIERFRQSSLASAQQNQQSSKIENENNVIPQPLLQNVSQKLVEKPSISEELIQELSGFQQFSSGLKYASQEQFQLAEQQFQDLLTSLLETLPERVDLHLVLMKRLTLMLKIQEKNQLLTPLLEDLYFKHVALHSFKNIEYVKILRNLLLHYCIHNIDRGSFFLDMLLEQIQQEQVPKAILRDVYLYAGIIHALKGEDFDQSERFFQEAIESGLQPIQKGIAYNNLACVTYWNSLKQLMKLSEIEESDLDKIKTIQGEILERIQLVAPLFKRAFTAFECKDRQILLQNDRDSLKVEEKHRQKDQINENQYVILKKLFDESIKQFDLTGLSSSFWLQVSQYSSTKVDSLARVLRTIVLSSKLASKENKPEFAENLLIDCLEYSETYTTYNKIFSLETYADLLTSQSRTFEADDYRQQADKLRGKLPYWYERKENILLPDYDFKF